MVDLLVLVRGALDGHGMRHSAGPLWLPSLHRKCREGATAAAPVAPSA